MAEPVEAPPRLSADGADAGGQGRTGPPHGWARWSRGAGVVLPPVGAIVALIGGWEVTVRALDVADYVLPVPSEILVRLTETWSDRILPNLYVTATEILTGFVVAVIAGVLLGFLIASNKIVERALYPLIVFIQLIPKIAVAPLFVVWFGFGIFPKVLIVFLISFFPTLVASMSGFKDLDPRVLYLTRSMGANGWQTFRLVRIPSALPFIFAGLRTSVVLASLGAVTGEFVGANAGLGYLLLQGSSVLDLPLVFATLFVLSGIGLTFSFMIISMERLAMPWKKGHSR